MKHDIKKHNEIVMQLKNAETFEQAKAEFISQLKVEIDYFIKKRNNVWRINKVMTFTLLFLLLAAIPVGLIGEIKYMIVLWVLCVGLWLSREVSVPMKKYIAYSAISLEAMRTINDCLALEMEESVKKVSQEELISTVSARAAAWLRVLKQNDI